jgi:hypothetical protein
VAGHDQVTEKHMRDVARLVDWERQEVLFQGPDALRESKMSRVATDSIY